MPNKSKKLQKRQQLAAAVTYYGADILDSKSYQSCQNYTQHASVSVYIHSLSVACLCFSIARRLPFQFDESALVRGALLHDYFLYDWHTPKHPHLHGYRHASLALKNASEDFAISPREADMIKKHMFPLNLCPPRYRESIVLCLADKLCTSVEVLRHTPAYATLVTAISRESEP